ncbi:MAG: hypothetical protein GY799_21420 [Desulfobulbaceae bacterium]|nr:hypothetical protein [Desulfobulbaceae bacterium]
MTTRLEAKNTLIKEFKSNYTFAYPVAYENDSKFSKVSGSPWLRFHIKNNKSVQTGFGPKPLRRFMRLGIITFQVFIPAGQGTYSGEEVCDHIVAIFEGEKFGDIYCDSGYWVEDGIQNTDEFQFTGRIFYHFDETK